MRPTYALFRPILSALIFISQIRLIFERILFSFLRKHFSAIKISAAIITFNEERNIGRCLDALAGVVDEIVVVDSFSKDRTQEICAAREVKFLTHTFEGHIQQKNFAITQTAHDFVLSLDADEALSEDLRESILSLKKSDATTNTAWKMNRLTNYCGHWVKHTGWYPDTKVRLFHKNAGQWQGVNPHDFYQPADADKTGFLKGDILHYSYYTRQQHLDQIEYFGNIASKELHAQGKKVGTFTILLKVVAQFIKSFLLKLGFLDGKTGFTISRLSAYATWVKYTKLQNLWKNQ